MTMTTASDPLGPGTEIQIALLLPAHEHLAPDDALVALHRAGLDAASALFIDTPTTDMSRWPAADAAFREAIAAAHPRATTTPLVWARVRTAPEYPSVSQIEMERYGSQREPAPRDPSWPPDFTGVPVAALRDRREAAPGSRILQHIPPGDGWHRVAWTRFDYPNINAVDLLCECSIQQLHHPDGHTMGFAGNDTCAYRSAAAYLRALSRQREFPHTAPTALRDMLDLALAGEWLGQPGGSALWGSNLYLQTVSILLDTDMPWDLANEAVQQRLIDINGAVLGMPRPARTAPAGPIMDWDSNAATDGDWLIWWSRLDRRYQVEVIRDPAHSSTGQLTVYDHEADDTPLHSEKVVLSYGAVFGPDAGDVTEWKQIAAAVVDARDG
ncbi:hypothetical protein [Tomitella cavernea]|nr:hypothetical protein [Tomitella cavernea]